MRTLNDQQADPELRACVGGLAFDQTDISRARALGRFLVLELDALSFAEQLEDRSADGAPVEEMLDPSFITNEPEAFVDEEPCNRAGGHTRVLR